MTVPISFCRRQGRELGEPNHRLGARGANLGAGQNGPQDPRNSERPIQTSAPRPDPMAPQPPLPYITLNRKAAAPLANLHPGEPLSRPLAEAHSLIGHPSTHTPTPRATLPHTRPPEGRSWTPRQAFPRPISTPTSPLSLAWLGSGGLSRYLDVPCFPRKANLRLHLSLF